MANLRETSDPQRIVEVDIVGWLLAAFGVVVTVSAWMVAYNANYVPRMPHLIIALPRSDGGSIAPAVSPRLT
jgi:hypothetical protein